MNNRIIVISQSINQPRIINRIISLSEKYSEIIVYTFKRNKYDTKNYINLLNDNIKVNIIGELEDGVYFNRVYLYFKMLFLLSLKFFSKKDVYAFGLDSGIFSQIYVFNKKVYEISDIFWLYKKGISRFILRNLDYLICYLSSKVCFTSEGFYRYYYSFLKKENTIIIENKFNSYSKVNSIENLYVDKISIAYIGAFRYKNIMSDILDIISKREYIELNFYGEGSTEINNFIKTFEVKFNNIKFHGKFKNPDDLEEIYKKSNLNFVCYDNTLDNERVALPNKYYESGFFNIPILCSKNTFLSELVEENDMGWSIDIDKKNLETFFDNISINEILIKHNNIKKIDKSLFTYATNKR